MTNCMLDILDLAGPIAILYGVGVIQSSSPSHIILKSHHHEPSLRDATPHHCTNSSTPESNPQQFERGLGLPHLISCTRPHKAHHHNRLLEMGGGNIQCISSSNLLHFSQLALYEVQVCCCPYNPSCTTEYRNIWM